MKKGDLVKWLPDADLGIVIDSKHQEYVEVWWFRQEYHASYYRDDERLISITNSSENKERYSA